MDPDELPRAAPRKVRFTPKGPPRRKSKPPDSKYEIDDATGDDEAAQSLLRRVNEHLGRRRPKVEKKSSVEVVFAHGAASSSSIRTYGTPKEGNNGKSNSSGLKKSAEDSEPTLSSFPSTIQLDGTTRSSTGAVDALYQKKKKDYKEPWDYHHTNYPTTLPLRRPYSGDPELLNEAEFGDGATSMEYDENTMNPALELELLEENDKPQMLFLQLPSKLPLVKPSGIKGASASAKGKEIATSLGDTDASADVKGKEKVDSPMPLKLGNASKMSGGLDELPGGYMGKMLVYKSGAIKWKLGDVIYDVSPGVDCICAQDVVAINTIDKNCCMLGEVGKRAILTPDIDSLLDNVIDLG